MLKFNSFREQRYLRSRFIEGKYLLASEASDIELELIDFSRELIKTTLGDVAIEEAWKVELYRIQTTVTNKSVNVLTVDSSLLDLVNIGDKVFKNGSFVSDITNVNVGLGTITLTSAASISVSDEIEILTTNSLLVHPGEAWFDGLPFIMRSGQDQLVSGSTLAAGILVVPGGGSSNITLQDDPDGRGKIITFSDGGVTPSSDYQVVISAREQVVTNTDDPFIKNVNIPESTAQKLRLTYRINIVPNSVQDTMSIPYDDSTVDGNLVNYIEVIPQSGGNGSEVSRTVITGSSEAIDGRNLEITIKNNASASNPSYSGSPVGNPIPVGSSEQQEYSNGIFVDSLGEAYHLNAIFNDVVANQVILRVDKEVNQVDPQIVVGSPYKLYKREVYVTDDTNGSPLGQLFWPVAKITWDSTDGFTHDSVVEDLRNEIDSLENVEEITNSKIGARVLNSGIISSEPSTIPGELSWDSVFTLVIPDAPDQIISIGRVVLIDGGTAVYELDLESGGIISLGEVSVTSTTSGTSISFSGSPDLSKVRKGNTLVIGNETSYIISVDDVNKSVEIATSISGTGSGFISLDAFGPQTAELTNNSFVLAAKSGNLIQVYQIAELEPGESTSSGIPTQLLDYVGSPSESEDTPSYSSDIRGTAGESLTSRIGVLTDAVGDEQEDRSAFIYSNEDIEWSGTDLTFSSNIILQIINTKDGTTTNHTIQTSESPITLADGDYAWVTIDRTATSENLNVSIGSVPAQTQVDKDVFILFKRIDDTAGDKLLYLPFSKQVLSEGYVGKLGASGSGSNAVLADLYDPLSTTLPTGVSAIVDGISVVDGDEVLFSNLSSNNNRIYKVSGVGISLVWTAQRPFRNNSFTPTDGEIVRIQRGDFFADQGALFDGTTFKINELVRYFNGTDYWEQSSLYTTTLTQGTTTQIFSVNATDSENWIIDYSLNRSGIKETGSAYLTISGVDAYITKSSTYSGDTGFDFAVSISMGDLIVSGVLTAGVDADIKYFTKRWSDNPGGPSGVPNYSGAGSSIVAAAGASGDIQFNDSGNLQANSNFNWNNIDEELNLGNLVISILEGPVTLLDNQVSFTPAFTFLDSYKFANISYSIERNGDTQIGRLLVTQNGAITSLADDNTFTNSLGVTFDADLSGGDVRILYTTTSTGFDASLKYKIEKWS